MENDEIDQDTFEEDEEQEEEQPQRRSRLRRYKKEEVMSQECHDFVMAGKRLPKLHSRWIYSRYINDHNTLVSGVPEHNRMVSELQENTFQLIKVQRKLNQIQQAAEQLKQAYPALLDDEQFKELERLADKDSAPRYDQP